MITAPQLKIALTGASGFIGQHVLMQLARQHVKTVAVTRDATRLDYRYSGLEIVEMDITHAPSDCFERLGRPDILIHLAWNGLSNYQSLLHFERELPQQYQFLKKMITGGLTSLLTTGTCLEYGMQFGSLSEDLPTQPTNAYAYAKDALRRQLELLRNAHPFALTWARLFYMYGELQSRNSLYTQLTEAIKRGDKSFNMSRGEQLRDYLPIGEVARLIVFLSMLRNDMIINVCSGKPISIRRLTENWMRENRWDIKLNLDQYPYPEYEPMAFWGNRRRLDALLEKP